MEYKITGDPKIFETVAAILAMMDSVGDGARKLTTLIHTLQNPTEFDPEQLDPERRIVDIVADAKEGKIPTHEECYWALLSLSSMNHFQNQDLIKIEEAYNATLNEPEDLAKKRMILGLCLSLRAKDVRKGHLARMRNTPSKYLGYLGNPFTEEAKKFRKMGEGLLKKIGL